MIVCTHWGRFTGTLSLTDCASKKFSNKLEIFVEEFNFLDFVCKSGNFLVNICCGCKRAYGSVGHCEYGFVRADVSVMMENWETSNLNFKKMIIKSKIFQRRHSQ